MPPVKSGLIVNTVTRYKMTKMTFNPGKVEKRLAAAEKGLAFSRAGC